MLRRPSLPWIHGYTDGKKKYKKIQKHRLKIYTYMYVSVSLLNSGDSVLLFVYAFSTDVALKAL